jgi:hypothetical protein
MPPHLFNTYLPSILKFLALHADNESYKSNVDGQAEPDNEIDDYSLDLGTNTSKRRSQDHDPAGSRIAASDQLPAPHQHSPQCASGGGVSPHAADASSQPSSDNQLLRGDEVVLATRSYLLENSHTSPEAAVRLSLLGQSPVIRGAIEGSKFKLKDLLQTRPDLFEIIGAHGKLAVYAKEALAHSFVKFLSDNAAPGAAGYANDESALDGFFLYRDKKLGNQHLDAATFPAHYYIWADMLERLIADAEA